MGTSLGFPGTERMFVCLYVLQGREILGMNLEGCSGTRPGRVLKAKTRHCICVGIMGSHQGAASSEWSDII